MNAPQAPQHGPGPMWTPAQWTTLVNHALMARDMRRYAADLRNEARPNAFDIRDAERVARHHEAAIAIAATGA